MLSPQNKTRQILSALDRKLFPFSQFEDCSLGAIETQRKNYALNRGRRNQMLPYLNLWAKTSLVAYAYIALPEMLEVSNPLRSLAQAVAGTGFAVSVCVLAVLFIAWSHLALVRDPIPVRGRDDRTEDFS